MQEREDKPKIISLNERQPELEKEVMLHLARVNAENPFRVTKKYNHVEIPIFKESEWRDKYDWEMEEIRRCKNGHDGLPGRYYYFFNHTKIKHKKYGMIRPDFRATQLLWAKTKERIMNTPGTGIVMIKRRQVGMSWDMSADNIYDCSFNDEIDIGMNSKSESDSRKLFLKHKYIYRNQSPFLKRAVTIDRRDAMTFGEQWKKDSEEEWRPSSIVSVAPTPTAHAGNQYRKLVMDESGECDVVAIWSNAEDTLMQDGVLICTPFIFGTMGDTDTVGQGLMEFWKNHKVYGLEQFAFWGYNCMLLDDLGNDDLENSLRWIIYERKKREGAATRIYKKFLQKYPIVEDDAFLSIKGVGVGDPLLLSQQRRNLFDNPPVKYVGSVRPNISSPTKVEFYPDPTNGKVIAYELPDPSRSNYIIATVDPAEDDDVEKTRDTSNLSTCFLSKPFGPEPPKLLLEYCDRPKKLVEYYQVLAWLLTWWNTKIHIELNKGGWGMLRWFQEHYPHLLALLPASYNSAKSGVKMAHGYRITNERKVQLRGLGESYVQHHVQHIPSVRLLEELPVVGAAGKDDDLAMAFLAGLMILQGDRIPVGLTNQKNVVPTVEYVKRNGRIELVSPDSSVPPLDLIIPRSDQKGLEISSSPFTNTSPQRKKSALFKGL